MATETSACGPALYKVLSQCNGSGKTHSIHVLGSDENLEALVILGNVTRKAPTVKLTQPWAYVVQLCCHLESLRAIYPTYDVKCSLAQSVFAVIMVAFASYADYVAKIIQEVRERIPRESSGPDHDWVKFNRYVRLSALFSMCSTHAQAVVTRLMQQLVLEILQTEHRNHAGGLK